MFGLFEGLSEWVVGFAGSPWAILVLVVTSFIESIFFPIPPDPLLIAIAIIQPRFALLLAALATLSSVAGAVVGYWLGRRYGRPIVDRLFKESTIALIEGKLDKYGKWAILTAAFTPLPYKVFAISAGVLNLDLRTFVVASLVGRGARFLALGTLIYLFGESITAFVDENFGLVTISLAAVVLAGVGTWALLHRRRSRSALEDHAGQGPGP